MTTAVTDAPATPAATPATDTTGAPPTPSASPATPPVAAAPPSEPPAAPPAPPPAPESYTLTLPQGGVVDDTDVATVTALAKAKNWTNEQAQAALDEFNTSLVDQRKTFRAELDAHPEIGGTHYARAQEDVMRAMDKFLPASAPEGAAFRAALNKSGYGDYAPLVLLLSRIGKAMREDAPPGSGTHALHTPVERVSDEEAFYGKPKPTT